MTNSDLIEDLVRDGHLKTENIINAFREVDRVNFVPDELRSDAYLNQPLPIGLGQTISQPLTVAFMLELLSPKRGEKILDVGAGSGWQTALLAYLVGSKGRVVAIERIKEIKETAERNISKYQELASKINLMIGDGSLGYIEEAPYDKIIAAAAGNEIPIEWKKQLKTGGVIVAPVKQSVLKITKLTPDKFDTKEYFGFSFVPLISN